jgi:phosphatidate cytidylyltransferase
MSPSVALADPVFRAYVGIVAGMLIGAGAVLAFLQFVFRTELKNVWKTYRSWLWMAPLAAFFIFAGRISFIIGVTALALCAFREFARISGLNHDRWMSAAVNAGIVGTGIAELLDRGFGWSQLGAFLLIALVPVMRNRKASILASGGDPGGGGRGRGTGVSDPGYRVNELQSLSLGMIAFLYLGWMFGHLGFLANTANAYGYLCYLILATEVNDVAAFICGKMFGRHPLRSEISPRKTWEGALGALAVSMVLPWLLRFSFPFFGPWQLLLTGLIVGIGGPLGDLSLSVIKRDLGTKDGGAAIPGHGGILDRIDSLIFVAPLFIQMAGHYYPGG